MNEREMVDALVGLLNEMAYLADDEPEMDAPLELIDAEAGIDRVETFETRGVLTMNHGLVVNMRDGSEFYLTVVQRT